VFCRGKKEGDEKIGGGHRWGVVGGSESVGESGEVAQGVVPFPKEEERQLEKMILIVGPGWQGEKERAW
jgi:hypothetical protein